MSFKKILVIHAGLYELGGGDFFVCRILRLLQNDFDVTLLHLGKELEPETFKKYYNIDLDFNRIKVIRPPLSNFFAKLKRNALLKYAIALRYARKICKNYDLVFSTYGECPLKHENIIQYIHIPLFSTEKEGLYHLGVRTSNKLVHAVRILYVHVCRFIAGWNKELIKKNTTVVNSLWTGERVKNAYGISNIICIYPAVDEPPSDVHLKPFKDRKNDFVMIGRIHKNKRVELGIQFVEALKKDGHNVHLHIVGPLIGPYAKELVMLVENKNYVSLSGGLSRKEMMRLIGNCRYGFHAYEYEHFGVAPAEMQRLGCIVFVPNSGGQVEVIGNENQRYSNLMEAIEKAETIMNSIEIQDKILKGMEKLNNKFTTTSFNQQMETLIKNKLHMRSGETEEKLG